MYGILMALYWNTVYSISIQVLPMLCEFCPDFLFCHRVDVVQWQLQWGTSKPGFLCLNQHITTSQPAVNWLVLETVKMLVAIVCASTFTVARTQAAL